MACNEYDCPTLPYFLGYHEATVVSNMYMCN